MRVEAHIPTTVSTTKAEMRTPRKNAGWSDTENKSNMKRIGSDELEFP